MKILTANTALVLPKFIFYRMQIIDFDHSTHKRYWIQQYSKIQVKIPSIPEQERIVARIEELFSELDKAIETLNTTKQQLAVYRQAVLKEAYECLQNEIEHPLTTVCSHIVDCPHSTPKWTTTGKLCLRTTNFRPGYLELSERNYVSAHTFQERISRLKPEPGDVLFSREGAILGIACIIPDGLEVCMGQRMMLLRVNEMLDNRYLMHFLNSPKARQLVVKNIGGSASPHINVGDIKKFCIPVVSKQQQTKIVDEIESRLSVCDSIEKTVDTALQQAEAMRQSILKQAFEGEI
jgi:type I restriction enzyme S subunit